MGFTTYEPAPHTTLYHTGIGGAGNYRKLAPSELLPSPSKPKSLDIKKSTTTTTTSSSSRPFYAGRGGIGNAHSASERAIFSFDEELQRDRLRRDSIAPMYAVGRGGAGNIIVHGEDGVVDDGEGEEEEEEEASVRNSIRRLSESTTGSRYSNYSIGSNADRVLNRLRQIGRLR